MVTRIGKKVNSTPFPGEPHVLMYILRGWRKWCGTSYVPKFRECACKFNTRIDRVNFDKCACSSLNARPRAAVWTVRPSAESSAFLFERVVPPEKRVLARNGYVSRVCDAPYGSKWKCFWGSVGYAIRDVWLKFSVDSTPRL
jgi:hypothetical protein